MEARKQSFWMGVVVGGLWMCFLHLTAMVLARLPADFVDTLFVIWLTAVTLLVLTGMLFKTIITAKDIIKDELRHTNHPKTDHNLTMPPVPPKPTGHQCDGVVCSACAPIDECPEAEPIITPAMQKGHYEAYINCMKQRHLLQTKCLDDTEQFSNLCDQMDYHWGFMSSYDRFRADAFEGDIWKQMD